jgi:1-acyl-sn-glycerol-3-phosphate acyltransferase
MEDWKLQSARDLGMPLGKRLRSIHRESGLGPWLIHHGCWSAVHVSLRVFHRLKVGGSEFIPSKGSFILAANHCSHLDAMVLASSLPWRMRASAYPIAAGDTFFQTPVTAAMSALLMNALPMWRKGAVSHSLADLRERLVAEECALIIFPEGTRSRDGTMGRFKAGLGMILAGTSVPVVPCRLWGTFESLPAARRWPRPRRIFLRIGQPLNFADLPNEREGWNAIAQQVESAVVGLECPV